MIGQIRVNGMVLINTESYGNCAFNTTIVRRFNTSRSFSQLINWHNDANEAT